MTAMPLLDGTSSTPVIVTGWQASEITSLIDSSPNSGTPAAMRSDVVRGCGLQHEASSSNPHGDLGFASLLRLTRIFLFRWLLA